MASDIIGRGIGHLVGGVLPEMAEKTRPVMPTRFLCQAHCAEAVRFSMPNRISDYRIDWRMIDDQAGACF